MKKAPIGAHGRRTERTLTHHHGNHFPSQIRRMTIDRTKSPRAPASLGSQASISPVAHGRSQPRSAPREERVDQGASVLWRNVPQKQPLQRVIQNFYTGIAFTKTPFSFSLSLSLFVWVEVTLFRFSARQARSARRLNIAKPQQHRSFPSFFALTSHWKDV